MPSSRSGSIDLAPATVRTRPVKRRRRGWSCRRLVSSLCRVGQLNGSPFGLPARPEVRYARPEVCPSGEWAVSTLRKRTPLPSGRPPLVSGSSKPSARTRPKACARRLRPLDDARRRFDGVALLLGCRRGAACDVILLHDEHVARLFENDRAIVDIEDQPIGFATWRWRA